MPELLLSSSSNNRPTGSHTSAMAYHNGSASSSSMKQQRFGRVGVGTSNYNGIGSNSNNTSGGKKRMFTILLSFCSLCVFLLLMFNMYAHTFAAGNGSDTIIQDKIKQEYTMVKGKLRSLQNELKKQQILFQKNYTTTVSTIKDDEEEEIEKIEEKYKEKENALRMNYEKKEQQQKQEHDNIIHQPSNLLDIVTGNQTILDKVEEYLLSKGHVKQVTGNSGGEDRKSSKSAVKSGSSNRSAAGTKLTAFDIVHKTYKQSYEKLVNYCSYDKYDKENTYNNVGYMGCIREFGWTLEDDNQTTTTPWWFRTLIRDSSYTYQGLHGFWHDLKTTNVHSSSHAETKKKKRNLTKKKKAPKKSKPKKKKRHLTEEVEDDDWYGIEMCNMEKIATKSWRPLFADLNNGLDYSVPWGYKNRNSLSPNITLTNGKKFVFLRDPLDRFLSAFIDKCIQRRTHDSELDYEQHCEPTIVFQHDYEDEEKDDEEDESEEEDEPETEESINEDLTASLALDDNKRALFDVYVETFPLKWNMHFFPQALYCRGLYRTIPNGVYDFVGHMGPSYNDDLRRLSKYVNSDKFTTGIDRFFFGKNNTAHKAKMGRMGYEKLGKETSANTHIHEYYTPRTLKKVLEYVSIDYVTLDLPIPQWAEDMLLAEEDILLAKEDDDRRR